MIDCSRPVGYPSTIRKIALIRASVESRAVGLLFYNAIYLTGYLFFESLLGGEVRIICGEITRCVGHDLLGRAGYSRIRSAISEQRIFGKEASVTLLGNVLSFCPKQTPHASAVLSLG